MRPSTWLMPVADIEGRSGMLIGGGKDRDGDGEESNEPKVVLILILDARHERSWQHTSKWAVEAS